MNEIPSIRSERTLEREEQSNKTFTSNFPLLQDTNEHVVQKI